MLESQDISLGGQSVSYGPSGGVDAVHANLSKIRMVGDTEWASDFDVDIGTFHSFILAQLPGVYPWILSNLDTYLWLYFLKQN